MEFPPAEGTLLGGDGWTDTCQNMTFPSYCVVDPDTTRTRYEFEIRDCENKVQSDEN